MSKTKRITLFILLVVGYWFYWHGSLSNTAFTICLVVFIILHLVNW